MLTAFAAMQELLKKLFESNGPQEFPWSVADWGEQEGWVSWMASGSEAHILQLKNPLDNIHFKRCTDLSFAWSGVMRIDPGHRLPLHRHAPSEVYYVLQGNPIVRLNDTEVQCHPQQVVSIPSLCPHGVNNPGDEAVLIAYTYLPGSNCIKPGPQHKWQFLEEV